MSDYFPQAESVLPLFSASRMDFSEPKAGARKTDPPTSHEAARNARAFVRGHALAILEALRTGPAGQTEIARRAGMLPHQVGKRLSELCREGYVALTGREVTNETGNREREWRVA